LTGARAKEVKKNKIIYPLIWATKEIYENKTSSEKDLNEPLII